MLNVQMTEQEAVELHFVLGIVRRITEDNGQVHSAEALRNGMLSLEGALRSVGYVPHITDHRWVKVSKKGRRF